MAAKQAARKVIAVTGIRSEYDILFPVIDRLRGDSRFEVQVAACGAHLSEWHGRTVDKIRSDGFRIADEIDYLLTTNRDVQRAKGAGILTYALAQTIDREKPDFMLVVGDREESIATAVVGNYMNVLVAHIGGGDTVYGNADDPVRFAVSKLAHIHFAMARQYAGNLLKVGEEEHRVFWVGNPAYCNITRTPRLTLDELSARLGMDINDGRYIVLIKHPLSSEKKSAYGQMRLVLEAAASFARDFGVKVIGIYPNTDPGSYDILRAVEETADKGLVRFFNTLDRTVFVNIMRNALALAGNSSMGILEAPLYGLPVVNIGNRQKGRLNAGNVEFVDYDVSVIRESLRKACFDPGYREAVRVLDNPFGDGTADRKIMETLLSIDPSDPKWRVKRKLC